MPKTEIDYSNTIIYKITCKDENIKDVYVGHTTNFVQRKHSHKQSCTNNKCKLYEVIRDNGGWNNWKMEIINFFECKDRYEARKKEQEYFISLNATLNSIEPLPKPKVIIPNDNIKVYNKKEKYVCNICNFKCSDKNIFENHNNNNKHLKHIANVNKQSVEPNCAVKTNCVLFRCEDCRFECVKKSNYEKHLTTKKHLFNAINKSYNSENATPEQVLNCKYCSKKYKSRVGLWYHNKKCTGEKNIPTASYIGLSSDTEINTIISDNEAFKKLILEIVKSNSDLQKQNSELQKQMIEICKNSIKQ